MYVLLFHLSLLFVGTLPQEFMKLPSLFKSIAIWQSALNGMLFTVVSLLIYALLSSCLVVVSRFWVVWLFGLVVWFGCLVVASAHHVPSFVDL